MLIATEPPPAPPLLLAPRAAPSPAPAPSPSPPLLAPRAAPAPTAAAAHTAAPYPSAISAIPAPLPDRPRATASSSGAIHPAATAAPSRDMPPPPPPLPSRWVGADPSVYAATTYFGAARSTGADPSVYGATAFAGVALRTDEPDVYGVRPELLTRPDVYGEPSRRVHHPRVHHRRLRSEPSREPVAARRRGRPRLRRRASPRGWAALTHAGAAPRTATRAESSGESRPVSHAELEHLCWREMCTSGGRIPRSQRQTRLTQPVELAPDGDGEARMVGSVALFV